MRFFLSAFFVVLIATAGMADSIVRGIAPNSAAQGETVRVKVAVEGAIATPALSDISFGDGVRVRAIRRQSIENRHERQMMFLQVEVSVDASAANGARTVQIADA